MCSTAGKRWKEWWCRWFASCLLATSSSHHFSHCSPSPPLMSPHPQRARRTTVPASAWWPRTRTSTTRPSTAWWYASPTGTASPRSCTPPSTGTRSSPPPTPRSWPAMASRYVGVAFPPSLPPSLPPSFPFYCVFSFISSPPIGAMQLRLADFSLLVMHAFTPLSLPPSLPPSPSSLGRPEELRRRLLHGPPDRPSHPEQAGLGRGV